MCAMILLIDNYDSFTWNLVQRFGEIDPTLDLRVVRNDKITVDEARGMKGLRGIIISPGPCTPDEAGVSKDFVSAMAGEVPILGVCLGHQCMGQMHGMRVVRHTKIMHGKTSPVHHDGRGIYRGMSDPFVATRYHSLVVLTGDTVPHGWEVSAWTTDLLADGSEARVEFHHRPGLHLSLVIGSFVFVVRFADEGQRRAVGSGGRLNHVRDKPLAG